MDQTTGNDFKNKQTNKNLNSWNYRTFLKKTLFEQVGYEFLTTALVREQINNMQLV